MRTLLEGFAAVQDAVTGCMTPMNLKKTAAVLKQVKTELGRATEELAEAAEIIEADQPLASSFHHWEERWTTRRSRALSPSQIVLLRDLAPQAPEGERTTYRRQHEDRGEVPPLALTWRPAKGRNTRAETHVPKAQTPQLRSLLADMISRPCRKCSANPGEVCVTISGATAERPHAGRRDASPLMMENRHLYEDVVQTHDPLGGDYYWLEPEELSQLQDERSGQVTAGPAAGPPVLPSGVLGDAIIALADSLSVERGLAPRHEDDGGPRDS